jgi:predicted metal-dependent phosphoesterase TrpH
MFLDLHTHTLRYSSCSLIHPHNLVYAARLFHLDGFAITEHDYLWREKEIEELKRETGADDLVILRGQEVRTYNEYGPEGDIIVFGYPDTIEGPLTSEALLDLVHASSALAVAAHPYRGLLGLGDRVLELELDGIEIRNPNHSAVSTRRAALAAETRSLAGIGASDAHMPVQIGHFLTQFERSISTESELVDEIKARRCKPATFSALTKQEMP